MSTDIGCVWRSLYIELQQYLWSFLFSYFPYCFVPTTCFGPYGPSIGGIYISQSLEAIMPTTDPFLLGYTIVIVYVVFLFLAILSSVFCMYEVDTIFFMLLHFYTIKIKLKLITMY
jgi:hypothetical protein